MRVKKQNRCDDTAEVSVPLQLGEIVEEVLLRTRRLLIVGVIDEISAIHVCSYLQLFSFRKDPVYMYIHSPGGCLSSGYAIIDQMSACACPIYTIVRGQAHSMGAIIAAHGAKGHRYATPNSSMMLHSVMIQSPPESIERHSVMMDYLDSDYRQKIKDMAKRMNLTTKQLIDIMSETQWLSPKQAIKIGLIDGIWTPRMEQSLNKECKS